LNQNCLAEREAIVVVGTAASSSASASQPPSLLNAPSSATNYPRHSLTNTDHSIRGGQNRFIDESAKEKTKKKIRTMMSNNEANGKSF
jgi:hypothetical protein